MDAPQTWKLALLDSNLQIIELMVIAAHRQVHLIPPSGAACIVPPQVDDALCAAIRQAREVASGQAIE